MADQEIKNLMQEVLTALKSVDRHILLAKDLEDIVVSIDSAKRIIADLKKKETALEESIKNKEKKAAVVEKDIQALENAKNRLLGAVATAEKTAQDKSVQAKYESDRLEKIKKKAEGDLMHQKIKNDSDIELYESQKRVLARDIEEKKDELRRLKEEKLAVYKANKDQDSAIEQKQKEIASLNDQISNKKQDLIHLEKLVIDTKERKNIIDQKTAQHKITLVEIEKADHDLASKRQEIANIDRSLADKKASLVKKEKELKEQEERLNKREEFLSAEGERIDTMANTLQKHFDKHQIPIKVK